MLKLQYKIYIVLMLGILVCALKPWSAIAGEHNFVEEMVKAARAKGLPDAQIINIQNKAQTFRDAVLGLGPKSSDFIGQVLSPPAGQTPASIVQSFFGSRSPEFRNELVAQLDALKPNTDANKKLLTTLSLDVRDTLAGPKPPGSSGATGATGAGGAAGGTASGAKTPEQLAAEAKAAEEAERKRKLEEDFKLQQAFLQGRALQQAQQAQQQGQNGANGGGGSGGGSGGSGGGSGGSSNQKGPSLSEPQSLDDAFNKLNHGKDEDRKTSDTRNAVNPNGFNNFGNSSGSGSSSSSDDKNKKDDKFNFDTTSKTPIKEADGKTTKKDSSGETQPVDASTPTDPSAVGLNNNGTKPNIVLSGPTSVGQLIQNRPSGAGGGEGGGGGGEGGLGGASIAGGKGGNPGAGADSGYLGGGDPFRTGGMNEMPPMEPPIRKVSVDMGGGSGGDGGESVSPEGDGNKSPGKQFPFVNQLVLTLDSAKSKVLGLMAFIGKLLKDECDKAIVEGRVIGVCENSRLAEEAASEGEAQVAKTDSNAKVNSKGTVK